MTEDFDNNVDSADEDWRKLASFGVERNQVTFLNLFACLFLSTVCVLCMCVCVCVTCSARGRQRVTHAMMLLLLLVFRAPTSF